MKTLKLSNLKILIFCLILITFPILIYLSVTINNEDSIGNQNYSYEQFNYCSLPEDIMTKYNLEEPAGQMRIQGPHQYPNEADVNPVLREAKTCIYESQGSIVNQKLEIDYLYRKIPGNSNFCINANTETRKIHNLTDQISQVMQNSIPLTRSCLDGWMVVQGFDYKDVLNTSTFYLNKMKQK